MKPSQSNRGKKWVIFGLVLILSTLLAAWYFGGFQTPLEREVDRLLKIARLQNQDGKPRGLYAVAGKISGWPYPFPAIANWLTGNRRGQPFVNAEEELGKCGPEVIPILARRFAWESNVGVRRVMVRMLGQVNNRLHYPVIPFLFRVLEKDKAPEVRGAAAETLGSFHDSAIVTRLIGRFATEKNEDIASAIACAVATIGGQEAFAWLHSLIKDASRSYAHLRVAQVLSREGMDEAYPILTTALKSKASVEVRRAVAEGLANYNTMESWTLLIHALDTDPDSTVRKNAAGALGKSRFPGAIPSLSKAIETDADNTVRLTAILALSSSGPSENQSNLIASLWKELHIRDAAVQNQQTSSVRFNQAHVFERDYEIDNVRSATIVPMLRHLAVPLLLDIARTQTNPAHGVAAIAALRQSSIPGVADDLIGLLREQPPEEVELAILEALGHFHTTNAFATLVICAQDSTRPKTQAKAIEALGVLADTNAVPLLFELLARTTGTSPSKLELQAMEASGDSVTMPDPEDHRATILNAMETMGHPVVIPGLLALFNSSHNPMEREIVARILGTLSAREAVPLLLNSIGTNGIKSANVVDALGYIGDASAETALLAALRDPRPAIRASSAQSLGLLGNPKVVPHLQNIFRTDKNANTRKNALIALGHICDSSIASFLCEALNDHDSEIRFEAAWALGYLGETSAVSNLVASLTDRQSNVRLSAAFSLALLRQTNLVDELSARLAYQDSQTRLALACALGFMGSTNGLRELARVMTSNQDWERFAAILALIHMDDPQARQLLKELETDAKPGFRRLAKRLQTEKPAMAIASLLHETEDKSLSYWAARALIFFNAPETVPALRACFNSSNQELRLYARSTVRRIERMHQIVPSSAQ